MTIRIKGIEDSREKYISIHDLVNGAQTRRREVVNVQDILNDTYNLEYTPLFYSERIVLNGLELTDGVNYDYVLSGQTITFNNGVLTQTGHILINYYSL